MFSTILIDGVIKLVEIIRYRDKPATARVLTFGKPVPDAILVASNYDHDRFIDEESCLEYRLTDNGMVRI